MKYDSADSLQSQRKKTQKLKIQQKFSTHEYSLCIQVYELCCFELIGLHASLWMFDKSIDYQSLHSNTQTRSIKLSRRVISTTTTNRNGKSLGRKLFLNSLIHLIGSERQGNYQFSENYFRLANDKIVELFPGIKLSFHCHISPKKYFSGIFCQVD